MKKTAMAILITIALSNYSMAQTVAKDSTPYNTTAASDSGLSKKEKAMPHVELKHGKPVLIDNGNESALQAAWALKNGSVVLPDGTLKASDGATIHLKEGDMVYIDGMIIKKK